MPLSTGSSESISCILHLSDAAAAVIPRRSATETDDSNPNDAGTDDEAGAEIDYADLIAKLDSDHPDDEATEELDLGEAEVKLPQDVALDEGDFSEIAYDGTLFPENQESSAEDDEASVDNLGFVVVELPRSAEAKDGEDELPVEPIHTELPPMDADANDEPVLEPSVLDLGYALEKRRLAWVPRRYVELPGEYGIVPCYALGETDGALYAAGRTIVKVSPASGTADECTVVAEPPHSVLSMIPLSFARLLCTTATGQLLVVERTLEIQKLRTHLEPFAETTARLNAVELVRHRGSICLLLSDGSLVRSIDDAATFEIEREAPLLLRITGGTELFGLARDPERPLWSCTDGNWRDLGNSSPALHRFLAATNDSSALLASVGNAILVGEVGRGVWLSSDDGAQLEFLAGSTGVTTIWAGYIEGEATALLATNRAIEGVTDLLKLDLAKRELERLLEISTHDPRNTTGNLNEPTEDEDGVHAIHYDAETHTLWLGGSFGLKRFGLEPIQ